MTEAIRCRRCGVRYDNRHEKCPKCGGRAQPVSGAVPALVPRGASRVPLLAGLLILLATGASGWWWLGPWAPAEANATAKVTSAGPSLLARGLRTDQPSSLRPASGLPSEIPFLDSPAAGRREYAQGNYDVALEHFRAQIEAQPSDAESYSNAGQALVRLGRTSEALPLLQKAVELDPGRWAYRFNLARAEGLLGQWDVAARDYAEASRLFPNDYATLFNLAQALHRAGREEDAVARYREAIEQKPDDSTFFLALGISEEKLGHAAQAASAYRRFLSMDPTGRHAKAIAERATQLEEAARAPSSAPPAAPTAGQ